MDVEILGNSQELEHVEPFRVETLLWGTKKIPETYGYLGYVPEDGFYLKMVCREKDPLRTVYCRSGSGVSGQCDGSVFLV